MEDRMLNEKESLELISQMIRNTRQKMEKNNGMPFLVWGYVTIFVSILVWALLKNGFSHQWQVLWFLIPIIGFPLMMMFIKKREKGVKTYIDKVVGYIWIGFGVAALLTSISAMFYWKIPILFIMLLMMATGTAITGLVIQFKPIAIAGFAGIMLSFVCLFTGGINQILVFAAIFLVMMVIPGHILNIKSRKNHV